MEGLFYGAKMDLKLVMEVLENMEDEALAASLLAELNQKTKEMGSLIMNRDPNLSHDEWKAKCDAAKAEVDALITKIESYK